MAPLRPIPSKSAQPTRSILKQKAGSSSTALQSDSLFPTSKKDKRRIKHAQLISKVTKSTSSKLRRRRPNKKLVTTLDALVDALPSNEHEDSSDTTRKPTGAGNTVADQVNVIKRKSLKSRPGAMKRKQKLDNNEKDRFAKNLAQMSVPTSTGTTSAEKLRALRGFISQTLEKRPGVAGAGG